ncbi:DUF418 domain-containing protein [Paenibacillus sp. 1011MAR3C5]|uniref:DUF418 domain-containing protein n=1 Tax=Paenibacillus sp. 1011MAR3C5 TaxID=1675787 RepID=UPI000E6C371C|nr:DUF418 domain-containing protein [Paenibacillus sp. 1011MAR3C5]RJE88955.1 DUF418 domain-containing protein [Paenibacillus sp. 1011MAR3C5]
MMLSKRIDELDYLRGFALLGILLMNAIALLHLSLPEAGSSDELYQRLLYLLAEARFFSMFSFLFGIGFYLFIMRANDKGRNGYLLFLIRIAVLLGFGYLHAIYHPGEALMIYAICGLLLLPFYKVNRWVNLALGAVLLGVFAALGAKVLMPFPFMLLGVAAGQLRLFERIQERRRMFEIAAVVLLAVAAAALQYQYGLAPSEPFGTFVIEGTGDSLQEQANQYLKAGLLIGPLVAFAYMALLLLLLKIKPIRELLDPMRAVGRMALTNYIGQTVLVLVAGQWLGLEGTSNWLDCLWLCLGIYLFQLIASSIWLHYFAMGPLEWIWRAATYLRWPPVFNKQRTAVKSQ